MARKRAEAEESSGNHLAAAKPSSVALRRKLPWHLLILLHHLNFSCSQGLSALDHQIAPMLKLSP